GRMLNFSETVCVLTLSSLPALEGALESSKGDMKGFRLSLLVPSELKLVLLDEIPEFGLDCDGESFWALNGRLDGGRRSSDESDVGEYGPGDLRAGETGSFCGKSARDDGGPGRG